MVRRHIDSALTSFDWDGADADYLWEPQFGSRLSRECTRWLRENGFSDHAAAGHTLATLFGQVSNILVVSKHSLRPLKPKEILHFP